MSKTYPSGTILRRIKSQEYGHYVDWIVCSDGGTRRWGTNKFIGGPTVDDGNWIVFGRLPPNLVDTATEWRDEYQLPADYDPEKHDLWWVESPAKAYSTGWHAVKAGLWHACAGYTLVEPARPGSLPPGTSFRFRSWPERWKSSPPEEGLQQVWIAGSTNSLAPANTFRKSEKADRFYRPLDVLPTDDIEILPAAHEGRALVSTPKSQLRPGTVFRLKTPHESFVLCEELGEWDQPLVVVGNGRFGAYNKGSSFRRLKENNFFWGPVASLPDDLEIIGQLPEDDMDATEMKDDHTGSTVEVRDIMPERLSVGTKFRFRSFPKRFGAESKFLDREDTYFVSKHPDFFGEGQAFSIIDPRGCWRFEYGVLPTDDIEILDEVRDTSAEKILNSISQKVDRFIEAQKKGDVSAMRENQITEEEASFLQNDRVKKLEKENTELRKKFEEIRKKDVYKRETFNTMERKNDELEKENEKLEKSLQDWSKCCRRLEKAWKKLTKRTFWHCDSEEQNIANARASMEAFNSNRPEGRKMSFMKKLLIVFTVGTLAGGNVGNLKDAGVAIADYFHGPNEIIAGEFVAAPTCKDCSEIFDTDSQVVICGKCGSENIGRTVFAPLYRDRGFPLTDQQVGIQIRNDDGSKSVVLETGEKIDVEK